VNYNNAQKHGPLRQTGVCPFREELVDEIVAKMEAEDTDPGDHQPEITSGDTRQGMPLPGTHGEVLKRPAIILPNHTGTTQ
jgi:hypothetical protein